MEKETDELMKFIEKVWFILCWTGSCSPIHFFSCSFVTTFIVSISKMFYEKSWKTIFSPKMFPIMCLFFFSATPPNTIHIVSGVPSSPRFYSLLCPHSCYICSPGQLVKCAFSIDVICNNFLLCISIYKNIFFLFIYLFVICIFSSCCFFFLVRCVFRESKFMFVG